MVMNIAANMLGLSNAATPMGLKAMEELQKLNRAPGVATNAMCTFLTINTAGLQLIPASMVAILASSGSKEPTAIIGTSVAAAATALVSGLIAVKIVERLPVFSVERAAGEGRAS
jgi:spore maturation protein A